MSELIIPEIPSHVEVLFETTASPAVMIPFATFPSLTQRVPEMHELSVDEFLQLFQRRETVQDKKFAKLWSPVIYAPGTTRKNENVQAITALVVDVDDGTPFAKVQGLLMPFKYVVHSSHSHREDHPKYRVILPLGRPVPASDWGAIWPRLNALVDGHADPAAKDPSRAYFLPSMSPGAEGHFVEKHEGRLIETADLPRQPISDTALAVSASKTRRSPALTGDPGAYEGEEEGLEEMCRRCHFIRWAAAKGNQENVSEPLWMAMLSNVSRFKGGRVYAHGASLEHSGYDQAETDSRLVRHRTAAGPVTCKVIREAGFTGCPVGGCVQPRGEPVKAPAGLGTWHSLSTTGGKGSHPAILRSFLDACFHGDVVHAGGEFFHYANGAYDKLDEQTDIQRPLAEFLGPASTKKFVMELSGLLAIQRAERTDSFYPDRRYVCLENGTLDVQTEVLVEHSPSHRLRTRLAIPWEAEARCPRFLRFLDEVFINDEDRVGKIGFLQQWFGYMLTPDASQQKMLWLVGGGANGKSVLLELMRQLVGAPNVSNAMLDTFHIPHVRAELDGKLINVSSEVAADAMINDGYIKAIVAGDTIEASRKYKASFSFQPFVRLIVATNNLPKTNDGSAALYRRIIILKFNRRFTEDEQNPGLLDELSQELAGILVWAVNGLRQLREQGQFSIPPSSRAEVRQYQEDANPLQLFVQDCLTGSETGRILMRDLVALHTAWCKEFNFPPRASATLGRALAEQGFERFKSHGARGWKVNLTQEGQALARRHGLLLDLPPSCNTGVIDISGPPEDHMQTKYLV